MYFFSSPNCNFLILVHTVPAAGSYSVEQQRWAQSQTCRKSKWCGCSRLFFEKIHRAVQQSVVCFENFAEKHFEIISKYKTTHAKIQYSEKKVQILAAAVCSAGVFQLLSWYIVVWPNQLTPGAEVFSPLKVILFQFFFHFCFQLHSLIYFYWFCSFTQY